MPRFVLQVADVHIRSGAAGARRHPEYVAVIDGVAETLRSLRQQGSVATVICGDVLHERAHVDSQAVSLFYRLMSGLAAHGPVFVAQGNHEYVARAGAPGSENTPTDMLQALCEPLPDVTYMRETKYYPVCAGFGLATVSLADVYQPGEHRANRLRSVLPPFPQAPSGDRSFAVFHGQLAAAPDTPCSYFRAGTVDLSWFAGHEAVLLGDAHVQRIGNTGADGSFPGPDGMPSWAYPGSTVQQTFGERLYGHGCVVWDLEARRVRAVHVRNPGGMLTLVRKPGGGEPVEAVTGAPLSSLLQDERCPDSLRVRVRSSGCAVTDGLDLPDDPRCVLEATRTLAPRRSAWSADRNADWRRSLADRGVDAEECARLARLPHFTEPRMASLAQRPKLEALLERYRRASDAHRALLTVERLDWSWILCYEGEHSTDLFCRPGVTVVTAPNGTGKTALLETLLIALFGEGLPSRCGKALSFANARAPEGVPARTAAFVCLDDERFVLRRSWRTGNNSRAISISVELYSASADGAEARVLSGKKAVDAWVRDRVGACDDFVSAALVGQHGDGGFLNAASAKDQMTAIDRAFGMDAVDRLAALAQEALNAHAHVARQYELFLSGASKAWFDACADRYRAAVTEGARLRKLEATLAVTAAAAAPMPEDEAAAYLKSSTGSSSDGDEDGAGDDAELVRRASEAADLADVPDAETAARVASDLGHPEAGDVMAPHDFARSWRRYQARCRGADHGEARRRIESVRRKAETARLTRRLNELRAEVSRIDAAGKRRAFEASQETLRRSDVAAAKLAAARAEDAARAKVAEAAALWREGMRAESVALFFVDPALPQSARRALERALEPVLERVPHETAALEAALLELGVDEKAFAPRAGEEANARAAMEQLSAAPARARALASMRRACAEAADAEAREASLHGEIRRLEADAPSGGAAADDDEAADATSASLTEEALRGMDAAWAAFAEADVSASARAASDRRLFVSERVAELESRRRAREARRALAVHAARKQLTEVRRALADLDSDGVTREWGWAVSLEPLFADDAAYKGCVAARDRLAELSARLCDVKRRIYEEDVLPALTQAANRIIRLVDPDLELTAVCNDAGTAVEWGCRDAAGRCDLRRASGFQRFMSDVALRIAVFQRVAPTAHVAIDEGFAACDDMRIGRVTDFLRALSEDAFTSVILVTHLPALQFGAGSEHLALERGTFAVS